MRSLIFASIVLLAACGPRPVSPSPAPLLADPATIPNATADVRLAPGDRGEISALIAETVRVMRSPTFDRNLRAVEAEFGLIAQSSFGRRLPAATVADLIAGRDPRYRYRPARVTWEDGGTSDTQPDGTITLRGARERWRSVDPLQKSLAINSLAHELSHTLSSRPDTIEYVFADGGFWFAFLRGRPPIASYTIGSVAQCTYLEEQGLAPYGLRACLQAFGVRSFTPNGVQRPDRPRGAA